MSNVRGASRADTGQIVVRDLHETFSRVQNLLEKHDPYWLPKDLAERAQDALLTAEGLLQGAPPCDFCGRPAFANLDVPDSHVKANYCLNYLRTS